MMLAWVPLGLGWLGGVVLLALDGSRRLVQYCAVLLLALASAANAILLARRSVLDVVTGPWSHGVGIRLFADETSFFFGLICSTSLLLSLLHEIGAGRCSRLFPGLLLLMNAGLHGAFFTADLFNFYVFFELSVATSFVLSTHGWKKARLEGASLYVPINLLGSLLFLLGIAGTYAVTGTLDFSQLRDFEPSGQHAASWPRPLLPAAGLIFSALSLKMGLFPFHGWLIPVYNRLRPTVGAIFSGVLVNLAFFGLLRLGWSVFDGVRSMTQPVLVVWGAAAVLFGATLAWRRRGAAVIIGYAAVMQAGYVVLLLGIGGELARMGVLCVALAGALDKAALFLAIDAQGRTRAAAAFIAAFGLVGAPLTVGFVAKIILFRSGAQLPSFWGAAVVGALGLATLFSFMAAVRVREAILRNHSGEATSGWAGLALSTTSLVLGISAFFVMDAAMRQDSEHLLRNQGQRDGHARALASSPIGRRMRVSGLS